MTPMEEFYFKMGALDCLELFARAQGPPDQARMKRLYVQVLMIPDILGDHPKEDIIKRVEEIMSLKISEGIIEKYVKPRVELQRMKEILNNSKFSSLSNLGI